VSTDKAANPVSLMGASKRLMEDLIFARPSTPDAATTSARFANVAFSNGSLLQGFLARLARRQPLAVPRDTARYFISQDEAGELCLIAATAIPDGHVAFPRLDPQRELQDLESVAVRVLDHFGLEPVRYDDEAAARRDVGRLARQGRWPLLLTPRDTSGEKAYEEFVGEGETEAALGLARVGALRHRPGPSTGVLARIAAVVDDPGCATDKAALAAAIADAVSGFRHVETGRSLDERL
jgi:hypothetical protein